MIPFKFNNFNKATVGFYTKLLLLIILFFGFKSVKANPSNIIRILKQGIDTIPKKIISSGGPGIYLNPIPQKTTCDNDFIINAYGQNHATYIYVSSNNSVATINSHTGEIHIVGPGSTYISALDPPLQVTRLLTVLPPVTPSVTIFPVDYPASCKGTFVTYTATPSNAGINPEYKWLVDGKLVSGFNGPEFKISTLVSGDTVVCIITDTSDCVVSPTTTSNIATLTVYPYETPEVTITQSPDGTVSSGVPITFTAIPVFNPPDSIYTLNYQWQLNGDPITNATSPTYTSTCSRNNDYFTCTIIPSGVPCLVYSTKTSAEQKVSISSQDIPITASIVASANEVYSGTYIIFKAELLGDAKAVSYLWQINGIDTNVFTQELGTYALKNNDDVRCVIFTNNGCTQVVTSNVIKMVIYPTPQVSIPNTFTPNGDGINDVWEIKYLELYRNSHLKIFNRYGSLLYQSNGYDRPWDGTYNGKQVPTGTYYYVIDLGIKTPYLSGPITVIR